jgi:hypothetical protein
MSVSTFNNLLAKLQSPTQRWPLYKLTSMPVAAAATSPLTSAWLDAGYPAAGSTPGAASIPTNATVGSIGQFNKAGTEQRAWLRRLDVAANASQGTVGNSMIMLVDRLAHMGGLDGTNTSAQTVGLGSLTRYTSGVGVWAAIQIYTSIGATLTTATISYTNTVPTAGQVSPAIAIGGTGLAVGRRIMPVSIVAGDLGVTAVSTLTLAATTGTVGSFGVSLYKTLGMWPTTNALVQALSGQPVPNFGHVPVIQDNSCLELLFVSASSGSTTSLGAEFCTFED